MLNTFVFVLISVPLLVIIPLLIANGIYRAPFKDLFRSIYFFPTVLSATAVGSLWTWLLATQGGAINSMLHLSVPWLVEQPWAWISIDLATVWWSLGFNVIIIYAGTHPEFRNQQLKRRLLMEQGHSAHSSMSPCRSCATSYRS